VRREFRETMQYFIARFVEALEDDVATPEAVAVLHEIASYANSGMDKSEFSGSEIESLKDLLRTADSVFAIFDWGNLESVETPEEICTLVTARDEARRAKDYAEADRLRDEIDARGYRLVDDARGTYAEPK
jgi:cysteinyl-tRNA synthetase